MIEPTKLYNIFKENKIKSFYGVPDSVLKNFTCILDKKEKNHFITANEGLAISGAIGSFLSSGKLSLVYMQNSGLGNALNPLVSIAHKGVYGIPLILVIGWRGFDGKDEPQHNIKGKITKKLLRLINIKYVVIENNKDIKLIKGLIKYSIKNNSPVAILIKTNSLKNEDYKLKFLSNNKLTREESLKVILNKLPENSKIVSTTGYTSREINEILKLNDKKTSNFFYMIGGMGHSSMVSFGISNNIKNQTICIDGDGALLMHLGSMITTGFKSKKNFKHILLNNFCHESVGKQKIDSNLINFEKLTNIFGYKKYYSANNITQLKTNLIKFYKHDGPSFFEILIDAKSMKELGRPKNFIDIKKNFMKS